MDVLSLLYMLISALYTEHIAGIIINLILVAANIMKWKTMKTLHIGDKILSALAVSRALYLFNLFLIYFSSLVDIWDNEDLELKSVKLVITMFLHFVNLWFASILCIFYCVKITTYNWKFFIFLKTKISTLVPRFLLACLLISVSSSLPFGWCIYEIKMQNVTNDLVENITLSIAVKHENSFINFLLLLIGSSPPFLVFLAANCLLLHSLWRHTSRMRSSGSGFRRPNLESHFSAVKSMSLFLVLQTIYFSIGVYTYTIDHENAISLWVSSFITCSPPSLHSLYIISSNSDLKKTLISMFHVLTCSRIGTVP